MKTKLFLTVALAFSLTVISCGNKKNAGTTADSTEQVCDSVCNASGASCNACDSACNEECKSTCAGDCEKTNCPQKTCGNSCGEDR